MVHADLKKKTSLGISYNIVSRVIALGLQAVANIVLTRNLHPSDYGVVGMAAIFFNFISQFNDLGIGSAIVRKEKLAPDDAYTAFTLRLLLSCLVFIISICLAPIANSVFSNPNIGGILIIYALNFLIYASTFLPHVLLMRDLDYSKLFFPAVGSSVAGSAVAVLLAVRGYGYWSLVFSYLCSSIAQSVITNIIRPACPKLRFDRTVAAELLRFGANISMTGFVTFTLLNADNFLVGKVCGVTTLGYYVLAFNWGGMICTVTNAVVSNALFPAFSRIQDDGERLRLAYLKVLALLSVAVVGVNMLLFVVSKEFLYFVLGHGSGKWFSSLPALQILCIYGIVRSLMEPAKSAFLSLGQSGQMLKGAMVAATIELGLIYPALKYGSISAVAAVVTLAAVSEFFFYLPTLRRHIGVTLQHLAACLGPVLLAMGVTMAVVMSADSCFGALTWSVFWVKVGVATLLYLLVYGLLTNWRLLRDIRGLFNVARVAS